MKLKSILLLLGCLIIHGCSVTGHGPTQVANEFYSTLLHLNIRGLPNKNQMMAIEPFLSNQLKNQFAEAKQEQEKFIAEANRKGEILKAPWSGGNLFGSLYEGMSSFSIGPPQISNRTVSIPVYLEYREDKQDGDIAKWIDILILEQTNAGWKVYDLFLCASWNFRYYGNLRGILPDH